MTPAHSLSVELKLRREEAGLSQRELARRAKVTGTTVNNIESRTSSARALGCTVAELIGDCS
jgi:transcriptional regulator with XRE-family HTH domain